MNKFPIYWNIFGLVHHLDVYSINNSWQFPDHANANVNKLSSTSLLQKALIAKDQAMEALACVRCIVIRSSQPILYTSDGCTTQNTSRKIYNLSKHKTCFFLSVRSEHSSLVYS